MLCNDCRSRARQDVPCRHSLPPMVETNIVRYLVTIDVNVSRLSLGLHLRHLSTVIRVDFENNEIVVELLIVLLMVEIDLFVCHLVQSLVLDLDLVRLSIDRLPPLVGNDRGLIDLLDRPPLHVLGRWILAIFGPLSP